MALSWAGHIAFHLLPEETVAAPCQGLQLIAP